MKEENVKTKLTEDQITKIYDKLEEENKIKEALIKAEKETEESNYTEVSELQGEAIINPICTSDQLKEMGLDDDTIEFLKDVKIGDKSLCIDEAEDNYKEVFEEYDISDEDGIKLLDAINKYKNTEEVDYDTLPQKIKIIVDGLRITGEGKISKNAATKVLLDSFINDAKFSKAVDSYNKEMNDLLLETDKVFGQLFKSSIDELYSDDYIDKLKEENPEQADQIQNIKNNFTKSREFKEQLDYLDHVSDKKLNKFLNRYGSECGYFNTKFNNNKYGIRVPKIEELYPIIKRARAGFTESQIKKFIIVIIKSCYKLDQNNINDLSYVYKMISNIYVYQYATVFDDDNTKELFENISNVIRKIINL